MSEIVRFTVSVEADLLERFDEYCRRENLPTRSEAIRKLLHEALVQDRWKKEAGDAVATLTIVYDHHHRQLGDRLIKLQHDHTDLIVSTLHVHIDHDHCLEVIVLRGPAKRLADVASQLKGQKGISQGNLVVARVEGK